MCSPRKLCSASSSRQSAAVKVSAVRSLIEAYDERLASGTVPELRERQPQCSDAFCCRTQGHLACTRGIPSCAQSNSVLACSSGAHSTLLGVMTEVNQCHFQSPEQARDLAAFKVEGCVCILLSLCSRVSPPFRHQTFSSLEGTLQNFVLQ